MHFKQSLLRMAAATTVTVAMTVGFVGPVEATPDQDRGRYDHSKGNASTRGDHDKPQPESRADKNDGGANAGDCENGPRHSYCSTRDGSASRNGKGDGKAKGKPCAGCVGKADNKNPKGQYPNGTDRNAGYECDRNQGIGRSNPAHTGCTGDTSAPAPQPQPVEPQPVEPQPQPVDPQPEPEPVEPETTCPQGATMSDDGDACVLPVEESATAGGPEALAEPEVLGVEAEREAPAEVEVEGEVAGAARAPAVVAPVVGTLPATGAGAYGVAAVVGVGLLAAGGILLARRRAQHGA